MLSGYEISGFALGLTAMFEISNEALYVRYDESSRKNGNLVSPWTGRTNAKNAKGRANRSARKKEKW